MSFILTMMICSVINGKTQCVPPITFKDKYLDAYDCMVDGYVKSQEKTIELGREDVNKYNIYIKFGCYEDNSNKTSTSYIVIKEKI